MILFKLGHTCLLNIYFVSSLSNESGKISTDYIQKMAENTIYLRITMTDITATVRDPLVRQTMFNLTIFEKYYLILCNKKRKKYSQQYYWGKKTFELSNYSFSYVTFPRLVFWHRERYLRKDNLRLLDAVFSIIQYFCHNNQKDVSYNDIL